MCDSASEPPECMSATQATPCGVAGASRGEAAPPPCARCRRASSSSGDSAVRLATTSTFAITAPSLAWEEGYASGLIGRQVRVPLAERAECLPELALGALLVEGRVDVRHIQRLAARGQPL